MSPRKKKKKSKNKIASAFLLLVIALFIVYFLYKIMGLVSVPSDIVVVDNGLITSEESSIRLYN